MDVDRAVVHARLNRYVTKESVVLQHLVVQRNAGQMDVEQAVEHAQWELLVQTVDVFTHHSVLRVQRQLLHQCHQVSTTYSEPVLNVL
jgi:hypothetical protein